LLLPHVSFLAGHSAGLISPFLHRGLSVDTDEGISLAAGFPLKICVFGGDYGPVSPCSLLQHFRRPLFSTLGFSSLVLSKRRGGSSGTAFAVCNVVLMLCCERYVQQLVVGDQHGTLQGAVAGFHPTLLRHSSIHHRPPPRC
jgi:hypothetical protein